jgi:Flp pilus assembly protein TadG
MRRLLGRIFHDGRNGQTLAEFALVLPVVVLVIFGIADMARAMQSYVTLQVAARDGARYAVTGRTDCTGPAVQTREACIEQQVADRTSSLNNAASITTSFRSWDYPFYSDPAAEGDAGEQCDAVEVEVNYTYQPITPIFRTLVSNSVEMRARERLVNEPFGTCT